MQLDQLTEPSQGVQQPESEVDHLLRQTRPTGIVSAAAVLAAGTGLFMLIMALQVADLFRLHGAWKAVPYVLAVVGAAGLPIGLKIYRQRVWAAVTGVVVFAITGLATGIWFLLSVGSGLLSLAGVLVPFLSLGAAIFSAIAIGACMRTTAARRRLASSGLDINV